MVRFKKAPVTFLWPSFCCTLVGKFFYHPSHHGHLITILSFIHSFIHAFSHSFRFSSKYVVRTYVLQHNLTPKLQQLCTPCTITDNRHCGSPPLEYYYYYCYSHGSATHNLTPNVQQLKYMYVRTDVLEDAIYYCYSKKNAVGIFDMLQPLTGQLRPWLSGGRSRTSARCHCTGTS